MEDVQGVCSNSGADVEEGDIQNVCEKGKEQGLSQLHLAAERGDTEAVRSLLMSSPNVNVQDKKYNTPLHYATLNGHVDVVNLLLSKNASVNSRNAFGQTSLHLAAEIGHTGIAQLLLDSHADVHVTDQVMNTPIHIGATYGHYELVQVPMKYNEVPQMLYGNTPLHLAAKFGHTEVAQLFLNHYQNPDATNLDGDTPLHHASENGHFEVVEVLLRNNADSNILNEFWKTPLHIAAELGYAEIVKALINHEGVVNGVDRNGDTALHLAANNGHNAVVNVLLNQTMDMDAQIRSQLAVNQVCADESELSQHPTRNKVDVGNTSLLIAVEGGNNEIADTLISHSSNVNAASMEGQATSLHLAVEHGHADIVEKLIFNSANVNACNNAKMTALHIACQNGDTSIVKILLDNHATVDVTKQCEKTPFYLAAENGHADISDLLLRRGVCDFVLTDDIQTPLHVAVTNGHTKVVELILKHSCRISRKLIKDGQKHQENTNNLIETTDIKPVHLCRSDGRRVSAGVVWAGKNKPLEIWKDLLGQTALELAVLSNEPKMVRLLLNLDQCAYSEEHLRSSFSSLIQKIFKSRIEHRNIKEIAKVKGDKRCEINCEKIKEVAQALINSSKFNVNHQINYDYNYDYMDSPLHEVMKLELFNSDPPKKIHLYYGLIQLLLEKDADFNIKNRFAETPLMIASQRGCCHAIQILFDWEHKSGMTLDLDARDRYGETALIKAAKGRHVVAVQLLLNHKASVNLQDYCGFTALHSALYEPNSDWFDLHFFCKGLRKRKFNGDDYLEISSCDKPTWIEATVNPCTVIGRLQNYDRYSKGTTQYKEEVAKLLLDNVDINVNAIDFKGNTPLDLAVMSSKLITSATFEALKNRGAIRKLQEPEDEASIEVPRIDERGRNPLHRLVLAMISDDTYGMKNTMVAVENQSHKRLDLMVYGILLGPGNFTELVTATDNKGRTPLHYSVMSPLSLDDLYNDLVRVLLKLGSNVNAADIYGNTPLHYAERNDQYNLLVHNIADENTKDEKGHTPEHLKQLRESVNIKEDNAKELPIGKEKLYTSRDIAQVLKAIHVTELTRHRLVETIRIYSQSPRPQESSSEAVWKIWTDNEFIRLNRRLSQLKPLIQQFIERLAEGIQEKDWRFECQPILVGSADEETKAVISADFDFNFKLIQFRQLCKAFPHPLGPKGYFQMRRKPNEDRKSRSDKKFDSFFNLDHCLLTKEVNSRFKIILEEVLSDPDFWQDEHLFDWNVKGKYESQLGSLHGLCKTLLLRMINPIDDGEGGFLFVNISIDIVACVHVQDWWPDDPLPVGISPAVKPDGCTFVFHQPSYDLCKPDGGKYLFSETFARISFAPVESRIIKESSPLIKAAYIVCKMILYSHSKATYQLKTCLLFCMEALIAPNGNETRNEDEITPKELAFWVERLMFCFMEFYRRGIYPCYFMPSFKRRVVPLFSYNNHSYLQMWKNNKVDMFSKAWIPFSYPIAYDYYLDLCPDDTTIDIPVVQNNNHFSTRSYMYVDAISDPKWEQFDREEFIRTLSSRSLRY